MGDCNDLAYGHACLLKQNEGSQQSLPPEVAGWPGCRAGRLTCLVAQDFVYPWDMLGKLREIDDRGVDERKNGSSTNMLKR